MFKLRRPEQKSLLFQILQYRHVRVLHKHTGVVCLLGHLTFAVHELHKRQVIFAPYGSVVLTKGRRDMNDTGTIRHRDISVTSDIIPFFVLFLTYIEGKIKQWLIFFPLEIRSLVRLQHFVRLLVCRLTVPGKSAKYLLQKRLCHIIRIAVLRFYLAVCLIRIYTESDITRQRPRRRRPC